MSFNYFIHRDRGHFTCKRPDLVGQFYECWFDEENEELLHPDNTHFHKIVRAAELRIGENNILNGICLVLDNGRHVCGVNKRYIKQNIPDE